MKNYDDKDLAIVGFIALAIVVAIATGTESFELIEKIVIAIAGFVTGSGIRQYAEKKELTTGTGDGTKLYQEKKPKKKE